MIAVRSPGKGLQPNRIDELLGKVCEKNRKLVTFFIILTLTQR